MKRFLCLVFLLPLLLAGCGKEEEEEKFLVYYLNAELTRISSEEVALAGETAEEQIGELLETLAGEPESSDLMRTIPSSVSLLSFSQSGYALTLDFSDAYYELEPTQEVLIRAAIVRTLLQVNGVGYVAFTVQSQPLIDASGTMVGRMNEDSFVENPGEQINGMMETELVLYFVSSDGTSLEKETRTVRYSSNISLEKLVIEQLTEGPRVSGLKATIPSDTKLITSSVVDGICYVNLDETVSGQNSEVTEELLLYSIVNSLTELATVDKVQISINGDTSGTLRYVYSLDVLYEADYSYLKENNQEGTE